MSNEIFLQCRFSDSGRGYGFAEIADGSAPDLFIAPEDTMGAMSGDLVLVRRYRAGESGYTRGQEGEVTKILERGAAEVIGTFRMEGAMGVVVPDDKKLHAEVHVAGADIGNARTGDKVSVRITYYGKRRRGEDTFPLEGYVTAVFGEANTREANYAAVLHKNGIPTEFSDDVIWEAEDSASRPISAEGRTDLRDTLTLTIDGADAKDLDDAISLIRTEKGWRLGVHIADVSHYVPEGGAVDREAYARGTSVYFVDKVVPMLPQVLSNGSCSLNGGEDRYALSALIDFDADGNMTAYDFKKALIRSDVRGVYSEVNDIFENGRDSVFASKYLSVLDMLFDMKELYGILRRNADERGQLSMESPEAQIVLDEKGLPTDILPRARGVGEMLIEQFMLAANVAAAKFLNSRGLPCLYRVHEDPRAEKMQSFSVFAHNMDLDVSALRPHDADPAVLSVILAQAEEKGIAEIVSGVMLRSLAKAKYSEKPAPHFGLAAELYCHFTSPIRRYPDLFVHRAITSVLCGTRLPAHPAESARVTTDAEIRATTAEREIEDIYMAQYASFHVGEEFDAVISSVCSFGVFARTEKLFEGLISVEDLFPPRARTEYDEERMILRAGERAFRLGDKLRVRIERADVPSGQIDFALAGKDAQALEKASAPKSTRFGKDGRSGRFYGKSGGSRSERKGYGRKSASGKRDFKGNKKGKKR